MKIPLLLLFITAFSFSVEAQRRRPATAVKHREIGQTAVVGDETLSLLRVRPSLFAEAVQRMGRGRKVRILGVAEADGVRFFKVAVPPAGTGWIQSDAVFGKFREGDDERMARFVQASDGFDQIELAVRFLELFPASKFRPAILLLMGDMLEDIAAKLSRDANNRLSRREMAATAAPMHSYYLNFVSLDRYRKLGITFVFNSNTRLFHYDGASWRELARKYPETSESAEALKRIELLKEKMDRTVRPTD